MKKIAFFTQNLKCGGVQKSVTTLAEFLKKEFDVTIILAESNQKYFYKLKNIKIFEIETMIIDLNEKDIGKKIFNYRVEKLDLLLQILSPDIVISYEDYNNLILLSTQYQCRKIISVRNSIYNLYKKNEKIHLLESQFYFKNIKTKYRKADKIITVSNHINNELTSICNLNNVVTIYNGISNNKENCKYIHSKPYILNIARLHKRKGHSDLIEAFCMIKDKIPHDLIIVGNGMEENRLKNLVSSLNLNNRVIFIGEKKPQRYIFNCELFVFPSKSEGFSNSILEVMRLKKNIISYEYYGSDEILPKQNLVKLDNISQLASKMLYYLRNKDENIINGEELFKISLNFPLEKTLLDYRKEISSLCVEL